MATAPVFTGTVNVGSGLIPATLDTSLTAPTNVTTILTAGASGSRIEEIRFQGVGTTVAGMVNVFRFDGTTYHLIDQIVISAVTSSTTAAAFQFVKTYANLLLKSGDTLRVSGTIAGNQSLVKVTALGGDF